MSSAPKRDVVDSVFSDLKISSHEALQKSGRVACSGGCGKRRRYWCGECVRALVEPACAVPYVFLPLKVDILQSHSEPPQKSTAQQVAILAPDDARIYRPFPECATAYHESVLSKCKPGTVAVLHPSSDAVDASAIGEALPQLERVIVLDCPWGKVNCLMKNPLLRSLPRVKVLPDRESRFWRYPPTRGENSLFSKSDVRMCLSSVEAVHQFADALNVARGKERGLCDNILWFFTFQHCRVAQVYQQAPGKRHRIERKSKGLLTNKF